MAGGSHAAVLVAALVSAGCAPGLRAWVPDGPPRARPRAGARADFAPPRFHEIFAAAVEVVRDRGLAIAACEAPRGALATAPVELEAPCGGTTCLARDTTRVKLGYRRARVVVTREVWDATLRGWREQGDPATVEELSREERALLARMVVPERAPEGRDRGRRDPCAPARCGDGACLASRGDSAR